MRVARSAPFAATVVAICSGAILFATAAAGMPAASGAAFATGRSASHGSFPGAPGAALAIGHTAGHGSLPAAPGTALAHSAGQASLAHDPPDQQPEAPPSEPAQPPRPIRFVWSDDRPSLRLGRFARIDFLLRLQGDLRGSGLEPPQDDVFDFSRRRVGVDGEALGFLEFQVERELRSGNPWRDVYLNARLAEAIELRGGKFKVPFSEDELTSGTDLDFVSRSLAARTIAAGRSVGAMLHGRVRIAEGGPRIGYDIGVFRQDGDNTRLSRDPIFLLPGEAAPASRHRLVSGRVEVAPFVGPGRDARLRSIRLSIAAAVNDVPEGLNSVRGRDSLGEPFFPEVLVEGRRLRAGAAASWSGGPVTVKAEAMQMRDERRGQGTADEDLPQVVVTGWFVSITHALVRGGRGATGAGRRVGSGGIGAIEVGARIERLRFASADGDLVPRDRSTSASSSPSPRAASLAAASDTVSTFGVTWRPVPLARVQFNIVRDQLEGHPWTARFFQPRVWSAVGRFQFAF
ncbi:MAG: porin [Vicinamibacterales bacterium]